MEASANRSNASETSAADRANSSPIRNGSMFSALGPSKKPVAKKSIGALIHHRSSFNATRA